jgi:hypothetical protein
LLTSCERTFRTLSPSDRYGRGAAERGDDEVGVADGEVVSKPERFAAEWQCTTMTSPRMKPGNVAAP